MNAAVYHLNFKTGKMEPMSAAHLLPVGSLISYEDMANPRQKAVVTGETAGEWGYGQACTFEDGHASQVHASDPDRHGRSSGGWHFVRTRDEAAAPVILTADEITAFLDAAAARKVEKQAAAAQARIAQGAKDTADRAAFAVEFAFLQLAAPDGKQGAPLASANLKKLLAHAFPGFVFSVRSSSFSGGNAVDVSWVDGPTHDEVDAIADRFQDCDFDGMDDSTTYRHNIFSEMFGGAKYVQCHRSVSAARHVEVGAEMGHTVTPGQHGDISGAFDFETKEAIYRAARSRSYYVRPAAAAIDSLQMPETSTGATVRLNTEKNGVEIVFPAKPAAEILDRVKAAGFRWSRFAGCWWAKQSAETLAAAQAIAGAKGGAA